MRLHVAIAVVCVGLLLSARAPGQSRSESEKLADEVSGTKPEGENYFTAKYSRKTAVWLALVEGRHCSERTRKLFRDGLYNEALGDCIYTLEHFPNHPGALHLLSKITAVLHQNMVPISYYEKALKYYPQHAFTHAQYGNFLITAGAVRVGIAELKTALKLDPDLFQARAWLASAQALESSPSDSAPNDSVATGSGKSPADAPETSR